jgi:hypothetical protein
VIPPVSRCFVAATASHGELMVARSKPDRPAKLNYRKKRRYLFAAPARRLGLTTLYNSRSPSAFSESY